MEKNKPLDKVKTFLASLYTPPKMPKSTWPKWLRIILQICGWGILALLPLYCLVMLEYTHFADKERFFVFFESRTPVVLFALSILYLIWFCVLCICKKGWLATLLYGGVLGAVSYVNYMKYAMTGDYFYPWDLIEQAGNVGELTQFITVPFPTLYAAMIALIFVMAIFVFLSGASLPLKWFARLPICALIIAAMTVSVSTPQRVTALLEKNSLKLGDMALQYSNYYANGFVGAFTVNLLSTNIEKPSGYSADAVDALLSEYEDIGASKEFSSPDIILILSESFWDPTLLPGTTFSKDPLANFREIASRENAVSGRFFTTGFGGGTVRPEFEVLTGMTTDYLPSGCVPWQYLTAPTESYVSIYHDMGYNTVALHPYKASFYSRKTIYPNIGIDALYFEDELYALGREGKIDLSIRGKQISDDTFVNAIQYYLDVHADAPVFLFGISMENHQPYPNKFDPITIEVSNPSFSADVLDAVSNYTMGVTDADASLSKLCDFIDDRARDTVLVWFGDHLPTIGANMGAYVQSGMLSDYDKEEYEMLYSTPFLVYANFELEEGTLLHKGNDNDISSYNLMNGVAELIGAPRTAFMQYLSDYARIEPYYHIRLQRAAKVEAKAYVEGHKLLTYDRVAGGRHSLK